MRAHVGVRMVWLIVLAVGLLGLSLAGCKSLQVPEPIALQEDDWLTLGGSPARTNETVSDGLTPPLEEAWVYKTAAAFGPVSPLIAGETVFVGTLRGEVHAIQLADGKKVGSQEFGDAITGTPVVSNRNLYVPNAWGSKVVYAYDFVDGRTEWVWRGVPVESGLLLRERTVIAADIEGNVHAIDRMTGDSVWTYVTDPKLTFFAAPVSYEDQILVADDQGTVTALEAETGEVTWSRALHTPVYRTPALKDEILFVPTTRGEFWAISANDGRTRWTMTDPDTTIRFSEPAVSDRYVVFGGTDGILRAVDQQTGALQWEFEADGNFSAPPLILNDLVFAGSLDRNLYVVDLHTGEKVWQTRLKGRVKSALAARGDRLIVLAEPRYVYAFTTSTPEPDVAP